MAARQQYGTVVIGGGQAGLAAGYHLGQHGRSFVILDAGRRVGDNWRARWDSLRLYSPASRDGLPGMPFPARSTSYPTKDEMADYLEAYAARFQLPVCFAHGLSQSLGIHQDGLDGMPHDVVVGPGARFSGFQAVRLHQQSCTILNRGVAVRISGLKRCASIAFVGPFKVAIRGDHMAIGFHALQ